MPTYDRGDVVVVLYPFTDGSRTVTRPALVVSTTTYNQELGDLVLAMITSRIARAFVGDHVLLDWQAAGLSVASKVRTGKLNTIASSEVQRRLGHLSPRDLESTAGAMKRVLGI